MAPSLLLNDDVVVYAPLDDVEPKTASAVLHRSLHVDPLKVVASSGNYLHLSNGQRILDATGGAAVACVGHGNEVVKKAILRQMNEVSYCHSLFYATSSGEALAKELVSSTHGHMSKAFIVSSGEYPPSPIPRSTVFR